MLATLCAVLSGCVTEEAQTQQSHTTGTFITLFFLQSYQ